MLIIIVIFAISLITYCMFCVTENLKRVWRELVQRGIQLDRIEQQNILIIQKLQQMDQAILNLQSAVENNTTVEASAVTLITKLASLISGAASSGDLQQVQTLADQLNASSTALAAAITANTPAQTPNS